MRSWPASQWWRVRSTWRSWSATRLFFKVCLAEGFVFLYLWISLVGKSLVTDARVPGRVLGHHVYYEKVGAEPYIVQTVKEGYR